MQSDASYLSAPKTRSRATGFFFLSINPAQPNQAKLKDVINVICKIIKSVVGSAVKSEIASALLNAHEAIPMRNI